MELRDGKKSFGQRVLDFIKEKILHISPKDTFFNKADDAIKKVLDMANENDYSYSDKVSEVIEDRGSEEKLNKKFKDENSRDLFLSLHEKEGDELYETADELTRRIRAGEAKIGRLGEEMERGRTTPAHIVGTLLAGRRYNRASRDNEETGRTVHKGAAPLERSASKVSSSDYEGVKNDIFTWAKKSGHYIDENQVKKESVDGDVWGSGFESRVYRKQGGKKVIKFMQVFRNSYDHALLKSLDDIALFNQKIPDGYDIVGYNTLFII